jgi:hypothetical protein
MTNDKECFGQRREGKRTSEVQEFGSSGDVTLDLVVSFVLKPRGVQESFF